MTDAPLQNLPAARRVETRALGTTGRTVSELGLGCAGYWARPGFPEARARAVLTAALEAGINCFDTGASYAGGHAEVRLGRLLCQLEVDTGAILLSTKVGTAGGDGGGPLRDFTPAGIAAQVHRSLSRLGVERLGLVMLHGPVEQDLTDELASTLAALRDEGRVALVGINGWGPVMEKALTMRVFDVLMPFISVMRPAGTMLAARAAEHGLGVLAAEPLARMAFRSVPLRWWFSFPGAWYLARALRHNPRSLLTGSPLHARLQVPGWTPVQVALAWVLRQTGVSSAVFGTTNPEHVRELAAVSGCALPDDVAAGIDRALRETSRS